MSAEILQFPKFTGFGPTSVKERHRLAKMFSGKSVSDMREMWDGISDEDSFYHAPDGSMYDCSDIHLYMNMLGDGVYCAV